MRLRFWVQETESEEGTKFCFEEVERCHEKAEKILKDDSFGHLIQTDKTREDIETKRPVSSDQNVNCVHCDPV